MHKNLDLEKLKSVGVTIEELKDRTKVIYSKSTPKTALKDLHIVLGSNCEFIEAVDTNETQGLFTDEKSRSELYQLVGEQDFEEAARLALTANDENDAPLVKLLNNLIVTAVQKNASDLHLDITQDGLQIKIRVNGTLVKYATLEKRIARMLTTRIKLLAKLDITERRKPQDGQISIYFNEREIDIRVATLPVKNSERIVLRFFTGANTAAQLQELGLPSKSIAAIENALSKQSGLILVCGPTGSGKTTTI